MNIIKRKWNKWIALPLAAVLVLGTILGVQMIDETPVSASGIAASNVTITGMNNTNDFALIQFDLGWDYSWRDEVNRDAAWVFVKYSVSGGNWTHATLATSGHTAPTGSTIDAASDGKGAFIYRSAEGTGSVSWTGIQLRWNYGTDGVADNASVTVKVFAIEMVYIPTASFSLGDGTARTIGTNSHFFDASSSAGDVVQVGATQPYISNVSDGSGTAGDIAWVNESVTAGNLPATRTQLGASFPTGYGAFYAMKYEISQRQYAEFLNTLTSTQAAARYPGQTTNRHYIRLVGGVYGCDANGNSVLNEANDGGWTASNWLSWIDGAAYGDWAGLRPMTELEFEKIGRGDQAAVLAEYAWGSTSIVQATGIANPNTSSETSSNAANAVYGNHAAVQGPLRVGGLTSGTDTRVAAGASYYGVMELSGNLWERTVTVGNAEGRVFTGTHGDGSLSVNGSATNSDWPGFANGEVTDAMGSGFRGGAWADSAGYLRLSHRYYAAFTNTDRGYNSGFRLVRTA